MHDLKAPKRLPDAAHEVIVVLDEVHFAIDDINTAPKSHELLTYYRSANADEVRSRVQCASIVITAQTHVTVESLGAAPYLKCVITPSSGTNHIDVDECRRRGIKVGNCLGASSQAVTEHALSLYFAARRKTVMLHNDIRSVDEDGLNNWKREGNIAYKLKTANGSLPLYLEQEVAGIIGYGHIGQRLEMLCKALGMKVMIVERKTPAHPQKPPATGTNGLSGPRTPFDEAMRSVTVLFLCCPCNEDTLHLIDAPELAVMRPEAIIVNISRAGVMRTTAVLQALREKRISGVAVDVYEKEPATTEEDSAFLAEDTKDLNLTLSPHLAYFSAKTIITMKAMIREHIKNFVAGNLAGFEA